MTKPLRVLIANRGEIALRIVRACRLMGLETIGIYSEADADLAHLDHVDAKVCIGPASAAQSYLDQERILRAARLCQADMVHPGYGFLSENPDFAEAVEDAGLIFIGPTAQVMRLMGDKISAKKEMIAAGVPCLPGSDGALPDSAQDTQRICDTIGYPLIVKASAGGGGRGMRIVESATDVANAVANARQESLLAFGKQDVYAERFLESPRHIEIQVMADRHGHAVWLGARDCSVQRRHQKLMEEAPPAGIPEQEIAALGVKCAHACQQIGYVGAGTFEFLYEDGQFCFIEMNTRLQVEHPVTEMTTSIDIVREQISVARGHPLSFTQTDVKCMGHAIECRINAENPDTFLPNPGKITEWWPAGGPGVRMDSHIYESYVVPPYYDSLIAKLIVYGSTREDAIERMRAALAETRIGGICTTIPLQQRVLQSESFLKGMVTVHSLDKGLMK
ncbi:acetyl-CoA carboxylase biotin carboxylase subunit [Acetobacter sp.]|jgi:acetyl-CoA carboxylase biotin carboxylase subunit|uniref:acetyl-CoA carboxylase biotin carboxylase subunit n=1 Tax=Acetobacter sp. TaxID=440 RepID=UPI0025C300CA|nr:acetyl-CoA carboxylase biotin carboxylase subunit [Acetobacter sp.]MCH4089910.1 acetyl-CoA carboxylase biotin carboxylase subunit [Acetobacter sp.]MCI1298606.1 acetyl-CoA carboxylase biotin carboxylase subunit [Acetobacter sp.]MCI1315171.1 acetyl-CoA carboxylase biotin carboxylase subunit [Acetobacter sp.]